GGDEPGRAADGVAPVSARSAAPTAAPLPAVPVLLSARDADALRAQAARLHVHVSTGPPDDGPRLLDLGLATATTRAALEHRAVAVATDPEELARAL
ncbi:CurL C-terminal domain-containing protein, partial [Streptomyces scabiei]|uniref:CurL C-terminal domain-containing protein n=2 Tax=Streptomyces TaxID=1883 RepID=UPI0038F732BA